MENFYEWIVERKKTKFDKWYSVLVILAGIVVILLLATLPSIVPVTPMFALFLQIVAAYATYIIAGMRNIEFEYCVTDGDIDYVDKIVNRRRRKRIAAVTSKSIVIMAPTGDSRLPSSEGKMVIDASSGDENAKTYTVVYENKGPKVLIFEPTEKMLADLQRRNPRKVFVGE